MIRCVSLALALCACTYAFGQEGAEPATSTPAETQPIPPAPEQNEAAETDDMDRWWRESWEEYLPEDAAAGAAEPGADDPEPSVGLSGAAQNDSLFVQALTVLMYLAVGLAALIVVLWLVQKAGRRARLLPGAELAQVLGRVYLDKTAVLHFVRTGGRVLVVGVTPNAVQCIAEFDADTFALDEAKSAVYDARNASASGDDASEKARRFFEELRMQQGKLAEPSVPPREGHESPDEEIATLRGDIARLQRMLREASDEPNR